MARKMECVEPEVDTTHPLENTRIVWVRGRGDLEEENAALGDSIIKMGEKIAELEKRIPKEAVIILRDISRDQARHEIRELFKGGGSYYYSEIIDILELDLELVVDICSELISSGEIQAA